MKSIGPLDFGMVIAYLLPGFIALYGLRYLSPAVNQLIGLSYTKDGGIGIEIAIVAFALSAGVVVSAFRANVLDPLQERSGVGKPDFDVSKLKDEKALKAYEAAISNTYRFAQFYGNTFVALLFLTAARAWATGGLLTNVPVVVIVLIALVVLFIAHRWQLEQTYSTIQKILS